MRRIHTTKQEGCAPRHSLGGTALRFLENCQQTDHLTEQGNALDEGGSQDHGTTNVTGSLRLTGNRLNRAGGKPTDTKTCTNGSQSCADPGAHYSKIHDSVD